jgi:hypothetical protein
LKFDSSTENGFVESFNGNFRNEYLNENWFKELREAQQIILELKENYNTSRPHSSLGGISPFEYLKKLLMKIFTSTLGSEKGVCPRPSLIFTKIKSFKKEIICFRFLGKLVFLNYDKRIGQHYKARRKIRG